MSLSAICKQSFVVIVQIWMHVVKPLRTVPFVYRLGGLICDRAGEAVLNMCGQDVSMLSRSMASVRVPWALEDIGISKGVADPFSSSHSQMSMETCWSLLSLPAPSAVWRGLALVDQRDSAQESNARYSLSDLDLARSDPPSMLV